jgi:hypothetical protein
MKDTLWSRGDPSEPSSGAQPCSFVGVGKTSTEGDDACARRAFRSPMRAMSFVEASPFATRASSREQGPIDWVYTA